MQYDDPPGPHCSRRLFEWTMALALASFGLHVLLFPSTMQTSRYAGVLLIMTTGQFALACVVIGFTRILALARNGTWPKWGPQIRACCAIGSAAIWAQLAVSLGQHQSPGVWVYIAIAGAELRSVLRARRDANGPQRIL